MKRRVLTLVVVVLFAALALTAYGCAESTSTITSTTPDKTPSAPALQPANHEGRFEQSGSGGCYGCHGAGENANPMLNGAAIIPEDHYVNNDYSTLELSPDRDQCITCHALAQ